MASTRWGSGSGSSPLARGLRRQAPNPRGAGGIIPARAGFTTGGSAPTIWPKDHPRSRGVYGAEFEESLACGGSSPLARGLLLEPDIRSGDRGIIPARAGFTDREAVIVSAPPGSSPLARGLLTLNIVIRPDIGIIPARAGFTVVPRRAAESAQDHPRSRGVYSRSIAFFITMSGSSPLARGLRTREPVYTALAGIIPARAGFTDRGIRFRADESDHPRSRGVYAMRLMSASQNSGSSPLARGLHGRHHWRLGSPWIIPARTGFTSCDLGHVCYFWDHPRSRGVYLTVVAAVGAPAGSSPLARGLLAPCPALGLCRRIIPARAGFTHFGRPTARGAGDHPRSRGVYPITMLRGRRAPGSSPLARGLPRAGGSGRSRARIIPARAGFTYRCGGDHAVEGDHPRSRGVYLGP